MKEEGGGGGRRINLKFDSTQDTWTDIRRLKWSRRSQKSAWQVSVRNLSSVVERCRHARSEFVGHPLRTRQVKIGRHRTVGRGDRLSTGTFLQASRGEETRDIAQEHIE